MIHYDPDAYEFIIESRPCSCGGSFLDGKCTGNCNGMLSGYSRLRSPEEYARIKKEKEAVWEKDVLRQAAEILSRRAAADWMP